jgi:DegV family protein with EDD domain
VDFGEGSYKDGIDLFPEQLFQLVSKKGILPKTAAPSPYDFVTTYGKYLEQGFDLIVITLSAQMSSTYQNAVLAASEFPAGRIYVVDSQSLTTGIGSLVMLAGDMAEEGLSAKIIAERLNEIVPRVQVNFVIDTLEYLYKGGRCNVVQNLLSTALRIRPIIGIEDGRMIVADKVRGEKKRGIDRIFDGVAAKAQDIDYQRIFVVYSLGSEEEAQDLKEAFQKEFPKFEILLSQA